MNVDEVFQVLALLNRWLPYSLVSRNDGSGKMDKIPSNGRHGLSTDCPSDWTPLIEALTLAGEWIGLNGVGFVMTGGIEFNGFTLIGFDFDDITPEWTPPFKSYAEKSPSKKGARMFAWGPTKWCTQFQDTLDTTPPNCDHCEVYIGTAARFLTVTFDVIQSEEITILEGKDLLTIESWGMHLFEDKPPTPPTIDVAGTPLNLSKLKLTADQKHLINGTGDIDRSKVIMGLIIKAFDEGHAKQEDIYATLIKEPKLWSYCMSHRNDNEDKALKFAQEEINRAYRDSMTGKREALTGFNPKWKAPAKLPAPVVRFPPPFSGLMADMVCDALKAANKPQPELTTLAVVVGMAAALGAHWKLPGGGRLNLYGCGIADTGDGKEIPRRAGILIAEEAGTRVIGKPGSLAGLEGSLEGWGGMLCEVDEVAYFFAAVNGSRSPSYVIDIAGSFLRLFSASSGQYNKRVLKGDKPETVDHAALSFIGFSTKEKLGAAVNATNVTDGMLGRFLFAPGREDPPEFSIWDHEFGDLVVSASVKARIRAIGGAMAYSLLSGYGILIKAEPEAVQAFKALMLEFRECGRSAASPYAKNLFKRSNEKANRLAGVIAAWDNPTAPLITVAHVEWAAAFVRASDAALLSFMDEHVHDGDEQADAAALLKLMRRFLSKDLTTKNAKYQSFIERGLVPRSLLMERAKLIDKRHFDAAVDNLVATEIIESGEEEGTHPNGRKEITKFLWLRAEN